MQPQVFPPASGCARQRQLLLLSVFTCPISCLNATLFCFHLRLRSQQLQGPRSTAGEPSLPKRFLRLLPGYPGAQLSLLFSKTSQLQRVRSLPPPFLCSARSNLEWPLLVCRAIESSLHPVGLNLALLKVVPPPHCYLAVVGSFSAAHQASTLEVKIKMTRVVIP